MGAESRKLNSEGATLTAAGGAESRVHKAVKMFSWGEIAVGAVAGSTLLVALGAGKLGLMTKPGEKLLNNMWRGLTGRAPEAKPAH